MNDRQLPWRKVYTADRRMMQVQSLSAAARGLLDVLETAMHADGEPYGTLPFCDVASVMKLTTWWPRRVVSPALDELLASGVLDSNGSVLSSPILIRRQAQSEAGQRDGKRGGNPALLKQGLTPGITPRDNPTLARAHSLSVSESGSLSGSFSPEQDPVLQEVIRDYPGGIPDIEAVYAAWREIDEGDMGPWITDAMKTWAASKQWRERGAVGSLVNWIRGRAWIKPPDDGADELRFQRIFGHPSS